MTYGEDLNSEGVLSLSHANVVSMLFSLIPSLLGLYLSLFSLGSQFLNMTFELLGFF